MELGFRGGAGGPLAVTAQNPGRDLVWGTNDDHNTPMNERPGMVTVDSSTGEECDGIRDFVRGFAGKHQGGVLFVFGDGSTKMIADSIDPIAYRALSTMNGSELVATD